MLHEKLGKAGALEVIRSHRETHITKAPKRNEVSWFTRLSKLFQSSNESSQFSTRFSVAFSCGFSVYFKFQLLVMMPGRLWTCTQLWSKCSTSSLRLLGHHRAKARRHGFCEKKIYHFSTRHHLWFFFLQFCFSIRSIFSALKNWDLRNWIIKIQNNHEDWIQKPLSDELNIQHIFRVKPFEGVRWSDETTNGNLRRPKEPYVGPALEYVDRAVAWAEDKQKCTATCCAEKNGWGAVRV